MSVFGLGDLAFMGAVGGYTMTDADAAAYVARVEGASGDNQTLEAGVRRAIDEFVIGCKADGIWSAIKASCILAGARTLEGALQPLVGTAPTNFNFSADDYNRKTGLVGDGSTKYLNSNRAGNADPQNNAHVALYAGAITNTTAGLLGGRSSANNAGTTQLNWIASAGIEVRLRSTASDVIGPGTAASGFYGSSRSGVSTLSARRSSANTSLTTTSDALDNGSLFVFARNTGGTALILSDWRLAFYSIGESLDLALLDARVTALINAYDSIL